MPQWTVRDAMTTQVITARDDASFAEIAAVLVGQGIGAVAIVNKFDVVVGVVSWTDLPTKIQMAEPDGNPRPGWLRRRAPSLLGWPGGAAAEVMSAPAITILPDASLAAAARVMYRKNVNRLLVADRNGRMHGIVTQADLLKIHARLDAVIRGEVMEHVLRRTLMIEPGTVQATVHDGVVTLTGRTGRKTTAVTAIQLTAAIAGVTEVIDRIASDIDDTNLSAGTKTAAQRPAARPVHRAPARRTSRRRRFTRTDNPGHPAYAKP